MSYDADSSEGSGLVRRGGSEVPGPVSVSETQQGVGVPPPEPPNVDVDPTADAAAQPPPQYEPGGRLIPITPQRNARYDLERRAKLHHRPLPPGPVGPRSPNDRPPPPGWHKMVHPEGQLYFYQPTHRVVTEAYIHDRTTFAKISFWVGCFLQLAQAQHVQLPATSELFLQLSRQREACEYYLIDHATRSIFWIDGGTTEQLGLPPVSSEDHFRILLEEQYWNHVEYFPNHIKLSPSVENEVRGMLTHSAADNFTSDQSTAAYTIHQCLDLLKLVDSLPTTPETNAYKNCFLARLMAEFCANKFVNHSGENSARLSRTQSILEPPKRAPTRTQRWLTFLFFYLPVKHEDQLHELWVDDISFTSHWRKFILRRVQEWREQSTWSMALAMLDAVLLMIAALKQKDTAPLGQIIDMTICVTGAVAVTSGLSGACLGMALVQRHEHYSDSHAVDATAYLEPAKSEETGFRGLSIIYSAPGALIRYSGICTFAILLVLPYRISGPIGGIVSTIFMSAVGASVLKMSSFFWTPTAATEDPQTQEQHWTILNRFMPWGGRQYSQIPSSPEGVP